jgi:TPR repeat protein
MSVDVSAAPQFPRVYRVTRGWQVFTFAMCGLLGIPALTGIGYFAITQDVSSLGLRLLMMTFCGGFVILTSYTTFDILASRLTLGADTIEFSHLFVRRSLRRAMIAGRRRRASRNAPATLILLPVDPAAKPLKIPQTLRRDAVLDQWLASLPDLDAVDRARIAELVRQSEAAIAGDPALGATAAQRLARLARARRIARVLQGVVVPLYVWCLAYPHPYELAVGTLAAVPWVAVLLAGMPHSLYRIVAPPGDAHPGLVSLMLLPGLPLLLRATLDCDLLGWTPVLLPSATVAAVLLVGAVAADRGLLRKPGGAALLAPFVLAYGFGTTVLGNALFDTTPVQAFQAPILDRHVSSGRHTTWYLKLAPWGPQTEAADVGVARSLYELVRPGQSVCVYLRAGALRIPWFSAAQCPADRAATERVIRLRQLAGSGDAAAQNDLAVVLHGGIGVPRNDREAVEWFRRAADQGNADAQFNLGVMYRDGAGVARDPSQAVHWFAASQARLPLSAAALGYMYETGRGVTADQAQARTRYESAAQRGNVNGQEALATMYSFGRGGPVDHEQAFHWYMEAARQGGLRGMNGVGFAYLSGSGVARDEAKGLAWLRAAADAGQPNAMQTLGVALMQRGMPEETSEGYRWLALAVRTYPAQDPMLPAARAALQRAAGTLDEQERRRIEATVASWQASPARPPIDQ